MQGYVSHLRRMLEPEHESGEERGLIVTRQPGYALRADAVAVDAERFERLVGEGRRALDDGAAAEAADALDEALGLWRGPALAEFAFDDFARDEIERLEELRLGATEDRIESLLRLGRHGELAVGSARSWPPTRCASGSAASGCSRCTAADGRRTRSRPTATAAGCWRASSAWSRGRSSSASSTRSSPKIPSSRRRGVGAAGASG